MDFEEKIEQPDNPREKANPCSLALFWWVNPLLWMGYKRELQIKDLYKVLNSDASEKLGRQLEIEWEKELAKTAQDSKISEESKVLKPSLTKAAIRTFLWSYSLTGIWALLEECVIRIFQPLFMSWLIRYFSEDNVSKTEAYIYGGGFVMMAALYTVTHHAYFFGVLHFGLKARVAFSSLIYRKALRLSKSSLGKSTIGHMVNLMSNDIGKFDQASMFLHYLWLGPLQLIIIVVVTWLRIGPATLAGAFLILLFVPLQSWMGRVFSKLRMETALKTDKRIRVMNEIINGIKVIKMYAWEFAFAELIAQARKEEYQVIRKTYYFRSFNFNFFFTSSKVIFLAVVIGLILNGQPVVAEGAFLTLALYNVVRLSMTLFFPAAISQWAEASVSLKRIQDFLEMEEVSELGNCVVSVDDRDDKCKVSLVDVTAKWDKNDAINTIKNVSLDVKSGELCGIIGSVGSGKSSLLAVILGEVSTTCGKVKTNGVLSYASQEAFVFSGSVRHNILFGLPFDEERYWKVVEVCALERDIQNWEHGDDTLVGEKGLSLSGGQKARINLARAIYREADLYLLDDPLSAVDSHVGKHLFQKCIRGYLKDKAVILVTHQLHFLREADNMIVLKKGEVEAAGSFKDIMKRGTDLSEFLTESDEEEEEEVLAHATDPSCPAGKFRVNCKQSAKLVSAALSENTLITRRIRTLSLGTESLSSLNSELEANLPMSPAIDEDEEEDETSLEGDQDEKTPMAKKPTIDEESRSHGSVTLSTYHQYFKAGGSWMTIPLILLVNLVTQFLFTGSDAWIAIWTNNAERRLKTGMDNATALTESMDEDGDFVGSRNFYLLIYGLLVLCLVVFGFLRTTYLFMACVSSANDLHNSMFNKIVRAPAHFFDSNPIGRILNRFSKDLGAVDELLPVTINDVVAIYFNVLGVVTVMAIYRPIVIIPTIFIFIFFCFLRRYYLATSRPVKRLEGVTKSPIFSQLSTTLHGLMTIRACKSEPKLLAEFDRHQDIHSSTWFAIVCTARWFGVCLDWTIAVFLLFIVGSFLLIDDGSLGGDVGIVLSSCMILTGMLQYGMRQSAEMENQMTSVERILEYGKLESEAELSKEEDDRLGEDWPAEGGVEFDNVFMHYGKSEEMVLKGLNFQINPREKVGIVGRTGAGKSSMIVALFRLTEPQGEIRIDGCKLKDLGLHQVRKKISIIPQDPILFTGSLRRNLDPFEEFQDSDIWKALEQVNLSDAVKEMNQGLETIMSEGGSNLSVGQRQLVCLARAILRGNKILVLDEATANVDPKTDVLIQDTIRQHFADCTVMTIAHRLHTVMDSDRILVLSDGKVEEFDTPYNLLQNEDGLLYELVQATDKATQNNLIQLANANRKE